MTPTPSATPAAVAPGMGGGLGALWLRDALTGAPDPLSVLAAAGHAVEAAGGIVYAPWEVSNQSLAADLSALVSSPVMARRGQSGGPNDPRYQLPEAARDGASMIGRAGPGEALREDVRARMEAVLGADLGSVRVHVDGTAAGLAQEVDAHAFTFGEHIVFGTGEFAPGTPHGDELLGHELTHVLQYRRSDPNTRSADPVRVKAAEDEADRGGARAVSLLGQLGSDFGTGEETPAFDASGEREGPDVGMPGVGIGPSAERAEGPSVSSDALVARDGNDVSASELAQLVHRYRRLHRRIETQQRTLTEFQSVADDENQREEAPNLANLRGDLARDREGLAAVLGRIRQLKGPAYANAIVERYAGEQETGPWTLERTTTLAEGSRGGGRTTDAPEPEETSEEGEASEEEGAATGEGASPEVDTGTASETGSGEGGGGSGSEGGNVTVDLESGPLDTGDPAPAPTGDPGAHVDGDDVSGSSEDGGSSSRSLHPTDGGVPDANLTPDGEPVRYVLHEGAYADVVLDVAYLDFDTNLEGNLGQAATLPELAQELRQATGIADVVRVISQFDGDFQMTGEIRAALDLIRANLTVEGAPWPFDLGGQSMLADWTVVLSARAYAEIYATGEVNPDLGNLSLSMVGRVGAAALAEASASMITSLDWMGDSYGSLAEVGLTAAGSAGAAAAAYATLTVGPTVIEIAGGASLTWGLGGSVRGRLRVAILPSLELIAAYLGVTRENLPSPLDTVYQFFIDNPNLLSGILDAWNWLQEMQPLQMLADLLTSEEFWALFDRLVEQGIESIRIIEWLTENYVQLDDTPPSGTICGHAFESHTLWYLLSFGREFLQWVERIGRDVALSLLPLMRTASRAVLTVIMNAGPWIVNLVQNAFGVLTRWGEVLGERFGPVLEAVGGVLGTLYERFGEPALDWVIGAVGRGWTWVTALLDEHGPPIVEWLQGLPERVQAWFEGAAPAVIDALYQGGAHLITVVERLGEGILTYIEQWAPGVVAIFRRMSEDLLARILEYGTSFFEFVVQVGENALQLVGPYAERVWAALQSGTAAALEWLAAVARDQIQPLLRMLDTEGGAVVQQVVAWIAEHGPPFAQWVSDNFQQFVTACGEVWAAILPHLQRLGAHALAFWQWAVEASAPVRAWLGRAAGWLFTQLEALGAELFARLRRLGELVTRVYEWGEPYLVQVLGLMQEGLEWFADFLGEYGPGALDWLAEAGATALQHFSAATTEALGHLIAAGNWTVELLTAIGAPLIPVLTAWGERLASLGANVKDDLLAAWRDYGAPVFSFMLRVGGQLWEALGAELSRAMPIIDRFVRAGAQAAEDFLFEVIRNQIDAMQVLYELSAEGLTRLYNYAMEDGVALAQRLGREALVIVNRIREAGEQVLFHFIEFGDWVVQVGENAAQPYAEVFDRYGPRYRQIFERYGEPIVRFFHRVGAAAAELVDAFGEAIVQAIVRLGEQIYQLAEAYLVPALRLVGRFGQWVWGHVVEFGQAFIDLASRVATAIGEAAVAAWESVGRPIVRFFIEFGQAAIDWHIRAGVALYRVIIAAADWWYDVAITVVTKTIDALVAAGQWLFDLAIAIGRPVFAFLGAVAAAVWADLVDHWQRFGRPVVDFCIRVGQGIGEIVAVVGAAFWRQIQADARAIYDVYVAYGAPVLQWLGEKAIEIGGWLWRQAVTVGRAHLEFLRLTGAAALSALQTVGQAVWDVALALGQGFRDLYTRYGQPIVDQLVAAGQWVLQVYRTHGAPIVQRCMDVIASAGHAVWEAVVVIGSEIWDIASRVGTAIWGWIRDSVAAQWRLLKEGGAALWGLCARMGRAGLDLIREYGPRLLNFVRTSTETIIQGIADRGAAALALVLEGGAVLLELIGEVGVAFVDAIQRTPELVRMVQDRGIAFGRLAHRHGTAFVAALRNAPSQVFDLVTEHGDWLAAKIVTYGSRLVNLLASHGGRIVSLIREYGDWVIDLVVDYGGRVLDLADQLGSRFMNALRGGATWALALF